MPLVAFLLTKVAMLVFLIGSALTLVITGNLALDLTLLFAKKSATTTFPESLASAERILESSDLVFKLLWL